MIHNFLLALTLVSTGGLSLAQSPPPPGRQPVSRTVFLQRIDNAFATVDTNRDGFADRTEIEASTLRELSERKTQLLAGREAAFHQLDQDKNGTLTLQEFNAVATAQPIPKPDATAYLTKYDINRDGKISVAENRASPADEFNKLDANKDGILSVEEQTAPPRQ